MQVCTDILLPYPCMSPPSLASVCNVHASFTRAPWLQKYDGGESYTNSGSGYTDRVRDIAHASWNRPRQALAFASFIAKTWKMSLLLPCRQANTVTAVTFWSMMEAAPTPTADLAILTG
eukprot:scaffold6400_cov24-Tisochrysis_lutea.AAC.2